MKMIAKQARAKRRSQRVRSKIFGTAARPRVSVSVSLGGMFVQFIDDQSGRTLLSSRSHKLKGNKTARAAALGKSLAQAARDKGITIAVFDRSSKQYHGQVKALAEALRSGGLKF